MIELSPDQRDARDAILTWDQNKPFRLGGLAGTGKTTIISETVRHLPNLRIAFVAFTGKASHVLREKLYAAEIDFFWCSTIHSLIYDVKVHPVWNASRTQVVREVMTPIRRETLQFPVDMIVVDEASMVDRSIWEDLCSYNIPVLAVGDFFQLPPISNDGYSVVGEDLLDVKLEHIHRQAERSPIIQVARWAREEHRIPFGSWSDHVNKISSKDAHMVSVEPDTLVLTGRNRTRVYYNNAIRMMNGNSGGPMVGDRVVCRRNNFPAGVANGMCGVITHIEPYSADDKTIRMDVLLDHGATYRGRALLRYFGSEKYLRRSDDPNDPGDTWDFAYALTVHCAQGSQARSVIVIEERLPMTSEIEFARWLYTGVTRATDQLLVIG